MHFITFIGKISKYRIEILLGICSVLSGLLLLVTIFLQQNETNKNTNGKVLLEERNEAKEVKLDIRKKRIFVEMSGAVYKPGVYEVEENSRLSDLLEMAEGLNKQADKSFFYRNYNQARILSDGEKVHAPSLEEVATGAFIEQPLIIFTNTITSTEDGSSDNSGSAKSSDEKNLINLNTSKASELEELPGIGAVTAEKIVDGRPYTTIQELRTKNIVSESLFTKIESSLAL